MGVGRSGRTRARPARRRPALTLHADPLARAPDARPHRQLPPPCRAARTEERRPPAHAPSADGLRCRHRLDPTHLVAAGAGPGAGSLWGPRVRGPRRRRARLARDPRPGERHRAPDRTHGGRCRRAGAHADRRHPRDATRRGAVPARHGQRRPRGVEGHRLLPHHGRDPARSRSPRRAVSAGSAERGALLGCTASGGQG